MKSLPKQPNLEFLKKEAKSLRALHRQSDRACCQRIRSADTAFNPLSDTDILAARFSINDAQRIIAREYGYTSWATLKSFIESTRLPLYNGVSDRKAYHRTITDSYDERSKNYDKSEWHRDVAITTVDFCPPGQSDSVLDVATGTGTIAFYTAGLVGPGGHVTGVDISNGMLRKCNEKLADSTLRNLDFIYGDGENLHFPPDSFDRIFCTSAIFWMSNLPATLRHWTELLKPGGYIGFNATPSKALLWGGAARRALARVGITFNCNIPAGDPDNARQLIELAGLDNFRLEAVESGHYISVEGAKGPSITIDSYSPGQFPHPLQDVPEAKLQKAQEIYEAEVDKHVTDKGVWHDTTQYYVYGQKPPL